MNNEANSRRRAAALAAIAGVMLPGVSAAQEVTVWSGYPEMAPFYEHVAEGMKADASRPHRQRRSRSRSASTRSAIALGLTSGSEGALVIELSGSTAAALPRERAFRRGARSGRSTS